MAYEEKRRRQAHVAYCRTRAEEAEERRLRDELKAVELESRRLKRRARGQPADEPPRRSGLEAARLAANAIAPPKRPQPGQPYSGTRRTCYLPGDATGARCLQLLMRAFDQGVAFRVGSSTTTGKENTVVWSIHQKTRYNGGEVHHGWPDPGYVDRLTSECAANNVSVD